MSMDFFNNLQNDIYLIKAKEEETFVVTAKDEDRANWHQQRLGKLTASRFNDMLQQGKGKDARFGTMCMNYIYEKVAELLTNAPHITTSQAMEWGTNMESEAIAKYEEKKGVLVLRSDFIPFGEFAGSSPDGLVNEDGIIEVKCPFNPANHAETIITNEVPIKYIPQIQGNLMTSGRAWCDYISYDPRVQNESLRLYIKRVHRDEELIKALEARIDEVHEKIVELYNKLKDQK